MRHTHRFAAAFCINLALLLSQQSITRADVATHTLAQPASTFTPNEKRLEIAARPGRQAERIPHPSRPDARQRLKQMLSNLQQEAAATAAIDR